MKVKQLALVTSFYLILQFNDLAKAQPASPLPQKKQDDVSILDERMRTEFLLQYIPDKEFTYPVNGKWADINYKANSASSWESGKHWDRLIEMAKIFATKINKGETDNNLRDHIVSAINFWQQEKPVCSNYWWNAIGVPLRMGQVLVLMGNQLPAESVSTVIQFMQLGIKEDHYEYYGVATGQNQVWLAQVHTMIGIVQKDTVALRRAFTAFHNEVFLSTGEGIQYDYSFFQHGHQLYSGGYGMGYTQDITRLIKLAHGTSYQFPADKIEIFSSFILKGQQWMAFKTVFDYSTMGREISRAKNADGRVAMLAEVCNTMASLNIPRKNEFAKMAEDLKEVSGNPVIGNKHFWRGDIMVHRTSKFYTSIKMTSSRIKSSEWGNKENEKSYYLGQGVQLVMRKGDEYKQIFPVWDWQKLPGTLAEQRDTIPKTSGPWGDGAFGKKPFTGGVSNGEIGFAVNDYELENVKARRAWFCFNNEIIVMGSGIENNSQNVLLQTVNQAYQHGEVLVKSTADKNDAVKIENQTYQFNDAGWVFHDSIAYFFPAKSNVTVKAGKQTGSWSGINGSVDAPKEVIGKNIFSAWIDFGKQVKGAGFMYAIVPGISKVATESYQLPIRLIANTEKLQAVWHSKKNILMACFYVPGAVSENMHHLKVSVNQPVLVILKETKRYVELSVSNPLNKGGEVTLYINRRLKGEGCVWDTKTKNTAVTIFLPQENYAGQSVNTKFLISK
jgi:chondroitin AC lyase